MLFRAEKRVWAIAEDFENWKTFDYSEEGYFHVNKERKINAMLREPIVGMGFVSQNPDSSPSTEEEIEPEKRLQNSLVSGVRKWNNGMIYDGEFEYVVGKQNSFLTHGMVKFVF